MKIDPIAFCYVPLIAALILCFYELFYIKFTLISIILLGFVIYAIIMAKFIVGGET